MNASSGLLVRACANVIAIVPGFFGAVRPQPPKRPVAVYSWEWATDLQLSTYLIAKQGFSNTRITHHNFWEKSVKKELVKLSYIMH